jgi:putative FmdB family regulatory protein
VQLCIPASFAYGLISPVNFRLIRHGPVVAMHNALAIAGAIAQKHLRSVMPTYEYACPKCGHAFELVQSMRDEPLKKCPKCKKTGVKRLIGGGAGLIFKGSGFYITDYKNKKSPPSKEGGGDAKPTESTPATPATPVKPAPATPAQK